VETAYKATILEPPSDLVVLEDADPRRTRRVALVGQPNVGKSALFGELTSRYVTISNFPGTTVEVFRGRTRAAGLDFEVLDTPGISGIPAESEDERATMAVLETEAPDLIVQVADAKNLRRALLLTAELSRLRIPMVLALNMIDESREKGILVSADLLAEELGIPVVETVATTGRGIDTLRSSLAAARVCSFDGADPVRWVEGILGRTRWSGTAAPAGASFRTRALTVAALAGSALHLANYVGGWTGLPSAAGLLEEAFLRATIPDPAVTAGVVVLAYLLPVLLPVLWAFKVDPAFNERFGVWARKPLTGGLILVVAISSTFQLVGVLGAQVLVELLEERLFALWVTPLLQAAIPEGFFRDLVVGPYGVVSMGLAYGIAIVLPVVFTFFVAFGFLEDSGYLPRLSILSDRLLRTMGLHGRAFLPMVLGLGCVTMATLTTRILSSRKERFIATFLLALGIPCSAQLGVILGITAGMSAKALLLVSGTVVLQLILVGWLLSRVYPGERSSFILELPPIRFPVWRNILRKTGLRVAWFLREALPLFALGALILFLMDWTRILGGIIAVAEPVVVGLLGLPKETATIFLMGFLRRDYGAAGLFDLSRQGVLDTGQIVVGLVVLTLFVPCVANSFVMAKEQGWLRAALMIASIFVYAVLVGAVLSRLLQMSSPGW
jgi:ferrous iron transport protein B